MSRPEPLGCGEGGLLAPLSLPRRRTSPGPGGIDPRTLTIDRLSAMWAHGLGRHARAEAPVGAARWDRLCPFKEGSPHRDFYHLGWSSRPFRWETS